MRASSLRLLPLFAVTVMLVQRTEHAVAGEAVYPGKTWAEKSPAKVGMDATKLRAFSKCVGGRGCVTRNGRRHFPDAPLDLYGAFGKHGNAVVVIPSLDLVVSWSSNRMESVAARSQAFKRLVQSVGGARQ